MLKIDRYKKRAGNKKIKEALKGDMLEDARDTFDMKFATDILGEDVQEKIWYEILDVQARERVYITSVLESGEKFDDDNPRIVLSTIHKAKGGEADNVACFFNHRKLVARWVTQIARGVCSMWGQHAPNKTCILLSPAMHDGAFVYEED